MKTSLHKIKTSDGLVLHGVLYEPDNQTGEILVHVHGMGGNFYENRFLDSIAKTLTDNGVAFCPFNNRGNGHITDFVREIDDKKDFVTYGSSRERFEDCIYDIQSHIDFVKGEGYESIHLSGHSLGSPKVAYYSAQTDEDLKSVIFLSPSDMLGLVRGDDNSGFGDYINEAPLAEKMIKEGKEDELLPKYVWGEYPVSAGTYMNLFGDGAKTAIFNFHNKDLGFEVLKNIKFPTLAIMGGEDDVLVRPIDEIMQTIKDEMCNSPKVITKIIDGANHGYHDHEMEVSTALVDWIQKTSQ